MQQEQESKSLTVVGIGASAGGLPALQAFFDALPAQPGMAFVVVTHMDPERESHLPQLLQSHTEMPVHQVQGLIQVEPNEVYVVPPNRRLVMTDTHLDAQSFDEPRGARAPIDHFFRSLASVHREAVAIILSGGGTDGAVGVKSVKERGGLLFVQDPREAEYDSMPRAAINTGLADVVLPVRELAQKLVAFRRNGVRLPADPDTLSEDEREIVYRILTQVQVRTGHDFSQYKRSTILRRIQRRMQLHDYSTLDPYLDFLRHEPFEATALFNDLLISVTNFFRDSEAWQALADSIVPRLFAGKKQGDAVRVWTIGCATGEEAYSVAILLMEYLETLNRPPAARPRIQVFASDLDDEALQKAREGLYPEAIDTDVSPERLRRFFTGEGNHYRVRRDLRDVVLFSNHNVLRDPPFSRLDLISCRNLLIYLQRDLQRKVFEIFHYALNPERYLFLGSSESADTVNELFRTVDKAGRIYQARPGRRGRRAIPGLPLSVRSGDERRMQSTTQRRQEWARDAQTEAHLHRQVLEAVAPPSVLVDETHQVLHISDTAGRFLRLPGGPLTGDLLRLVRQELRHELSAALSRALEQNQPVLGAPVLVQFNGAPRRVVVAVHPRAGRHAAARQSAEEQRERLALVFFLEDQSSRGQLDRAASTDAGGGDRAQQQALVAQLEQEVQWLRERLQSTVEEYESSNEELKAANEELQSINEEYRSTTEQLETSQEELQSVNEELQTVNSELKNKLEEISRAHSDLENLMNATDVVTLFLDRELRIQRYTPGTAELFNIMRGDRGRPLAHLTHHLDYDSLEADAREVMRTLDSVEREIRTEDDNGAGRAWYLLRMRPYRTVDDRVDGVVLTLVDVTSTKRTEQALRATRERYRLIVDSTQEYAMFTMDAEGRIETWNQGGQRAFGYEEAEVQGQTGAIIFTPEDLAAGAYQQEMARAREEGQASDERWHVRKDGSRFWGSGVTTSLWDGDRLRGFAKVLRDNTKRKEAEEALRRSEEALRALNERLEEMVQARTETLQQRTEEVRQLAAQLAIAEQEERNRIALVLHDDLQQRLYALQMQATFLRNAHEEGDDAAFSQELAELEKEIEKAIGTTRELNVDLSPPILHDEGLADAIGWLARHVAEQYKLQVKLEAEGAMLIADEGLRVLLFQAVRELLFNVVKHAATNEARVQLKQTDGELWITVSDEGPGFDAAILEESGAQSSGLATLRRRLKLVGGRIELQSRPDEGTRATVVAPLALQSWTRGGSKGDA